MHVWVSITLWYTEETNHVSNIIFFNQGDFYFPSIIRVGFDLASGIEVFKSVFINPDFLPLFTPFEEGVWVAKKNTQMTMIFN